MTANKTLAIKDAAYNVLYANLENHRTVLWVLRKDVTPGYHLIVFWAILLRQWLELKVGDDYQLCTDATTVLSKMRIMPERRHLDSPQTFIGRLRRAAGKQNRAEREAARRENRKPVLAPRITIKNKHVHIDTKKVRAALRRRR